MIVALHTALVRLPARPGLQWHTWYCALSPDPAVQGHGDFRTDAGIVLDQSDVGIQALTACCLFDRGEQKRRDSLPGDLFLTDFRQGYVNRGACRLSGKALCFWHRHAEQHPAI